MSPESRSSTKPSRRRTPLGQPVSYIQWLIEKNLAPGAIVILHDGISNPRKSIQALPHVLATGKQRGIRFVTVGELFVARITVPGTNQSP